ncbi:unnamed protein product, partial [Protopolystoma xenopodis]
IGDPEEEEEAERHSGHQNKGSLGCESTILVSPHMAPDISLNCWLQALPADCFARPFQSRQLALCLRRLQRPGLEPSLWPDQILAEPLIRPLIFPYTHLPALTTAHNATMAGCCGPGLMTRSGRRIGVAGAGLLARSLLPAYEVSFEWDKNLLHYFLKLQICWLFAIHIAFK